MPPLPLGLVRTGVALLLLAVSVPCSAQLKNPQGVPVLLLSGGQREHHGYRDQANALAKALEQTGQFRVTIAEDAAILETEALNKYKGLIVLTDRRDPEFKFTLAQQQAMLHFVHDQGGGFVTIHGGDNAAPDWTLDLRVMYGGVFSHDTSRRGPDSKTRKGDYRVHIKTPENPVCQGISDFDLKDELYYKLQEEPGNTILASITLDNEERPVAWVRTHGKGRVFHTVFGHRDFGPDKHDPLQTPELLKLVTRGLAWATSGPAPAEPAAKP